MVGLSFWIEGKPEPQGSKTAGNRKDGSAFLRDKNPAGLKVWRDAVAKGVKAQLPPEWEPITKGVFLRMTFWLPRPKDRPKSIDVLPIVRPDVDKLARAVMDSLTRSGVFKDDAQVFDMHPVKRYAIDPVALPKIYMPGYHRPVPGVDIRLAWLSA